MTSISRARTTAPRSLALLAAVLAFASASTGTATAQEPQDAFPRARLVVTGLTGVLGPGSVPPDRAETASSDLDLRLLIENDGVVDLPNLRVVVEVYDDVRSRSVLREAVDGGRMDHDLLHDVFVEVRDGGTVRTGDIAGLTVTVPGEDIGWSSRGGVFPVQITVLRGSEVLDRAVTAVVHLVDPPDGALRTVIVWPLDSAPWRGPGGVYPAGVDDEIAPGGRLDRILSGIESQLEVAPDAPVHLAPAPHLLEDLQDRAGGFVESVMTDEGLQVREVSPDDPPAQRAEAFLQRVRAVTSSLPVPPLAGPYADDDIAGMVAAAEPLPETAGVATSEGRRRIQRLTRRAPDASTYVATTPLTRRALDVVPGDHLLLPWDFVSGPDLSSNPDLPFALRSVTAASGKRFTATVADPRVAALLVTPDLTHGPLLATQRIIAETGMIFLEAPARHGRPLLVMPPPDWQPASRIPATLLTSLTDAAWLELTTPTTQVAAADTPFPALRFAEDRVLPLPAGISGELIRAHTDLAAIRTALPDGDNTIDDRTLASLSNQLLRASSTWFRGGDVGGAAALIRDVAAAVDGAFGSVEIPNSANITLPSDTGNIPVTLRRPSGAPLRVCVAVNSPGRLLWDDERDCSVTLAGDSSQTVSFRTRALSRGRFPVTVTVTDPAGVRELGRATLTVRSTSISRPALTVTGAVVAVLLLWGSVRRRRPPRPRLEVVE